jgi:hypothetical protein
VKRNMAKDWRLKHTTKSSADLGVDEQTNRQNVGGLAGPPHTCKIVFLILTRTAAACHFPGPSSPPPPLGQTGEGKSWI